MSIGEATSHIETAQRYGIQVEDSAVVAAAFTLHPSRHRFRVRGHDLYTWRGFDVPADHPPGDRREGPQPRGR